MRIMVADMVVLGFPTEIAGASALCDTVTCR